MREHISQAIDRIFMDYEDTPELNDFKEEIVMNVSEHVHDMMGKGMGRQQALDKALAELGDITEAANEVSRQKRKEVIGQAYAKAVPLDKAHAIGYPIAGAVSLLGLLFAAYTLLASGYLTRGFVTLSPFAALAAGGFACLGLTQETSSHYPMARKRSLIYSIASAVLVFGVFCALGFLFSDITLQSLSQDGWSIAELLDNARAALILFIPFALPSLMVLAVLFLSEKDRKKPWVLRLEEESAKMYGESFGLLSGALWILVVALFVLLGMVTGFRISWVVFLFGAAAQCVLQFFYARKHEQ